MNRRQLLIGAGGVLTLPLLARMRAARACPPGVAPKRLVVFHWPQGMVMRDWVPQGGPTDFELPFVSAPLERHRERVLFVSGCDNLMPTLNSVGNAHYNANFTFLTGRPFLVQDNDDLSAAGPSIEQVIAERIAGDTPFPRLDLAIGGGETSNGFYTPTEGSTFWVGARDPVGFYNDPVLTALRVFGDATLTQEELWAIRSGRSAVLDGVLQNFDAVRGELTGAELSRLDAHQTKLEQLEARISAGTGACTAPDVTLPPGTQYGSDDNLTAPVQLDILTTALACDMTRVATLSFGNSQDHSFHWLWGDNGGQPIVDTSLFTDWHAMVHADYQPGMELVYRWYIQTLAELLDRLAATTDADGDNLLDTTLVMGLSEYSSGRHWNNNLPVVLAGCVGGAEMGRHLDLRPGTTDDYEAAGGYLNSGVSTNQLFTSLLHAFGQPDQDFGHTGDGIPNGPLPGLL